MTLVVGYCLRLATEILSDARLVRREREARAAARETAHTDRRDDFQRGTLLELQDALLDFTRLSFELHQEDRSNFKSSGKWGGDQLVSCTRS